MTWPQPKGKRLLLVADCDVDPAFTGSLGRALGVEVDVLSIDTTGGKRAWRLYRHLTYGLLALRALLRQRRYRYTVFWQLFTGLYFSPFSRLAPLKRADATIIALHLIYRPRKGLPGEIYRRLFGALLDSPSIDAFVCHTSREADAYAAEFGEHLRSKLRYIEYGAGSSAEAPRRPGPVRDIPVFFAGGTSNRDYATLIEAFRGRPERLRILCFEQDVAGLSLPDNVSLTTGAFGEEFAAAMGETGAVIVTLDNPDIASGHLVLLEAMRQGKPIIATRGACTSDLIDDACALRVQPHSVGALRAAIEELAAEPAWRQELAENARRRFESRFTVERYAERIAELLLARSREKAPWAESEKPPLLTPRINDETPHAS